jgi:hypothetical protein
MFPTHGNPAFLAISTGKPGGPEIDRESEVRMAHPCIS